MDQNLADHSDKPVLNFLSKKTKNNKVINKKHFALKI